MGLERPLARLTLFIVAALALAGDPSIGFRSAAAQSVLAARQMRDAGSFAEQFFNDIRDARYEDAFSKMDRRVQNLGRFGVTGVFRAKRNYLIGSVPDERYTFVTAQNPLQALSCVETGDKKNARKLYLSARLIKRSTADGWKVLGFKIGSVPESGCPA